MGVASPETPYQRNVASTSCWSATLPCSVKIEYITVTAGDDYITSMESIKPRFFEARPLLYAPRDKVAMKLDCLQNDVILTRIDWSDWATPVVGRQEERLRLPVRRGQGLPETPVKSRPVSATARRQRLCITRRRTAISEDRPPPSLPST